MTDTDNLIVDKITHQDGSVEEGAFDKDTGNLIDG